jgi:regulator of PEP synthase PpsR (kinase-PPPase family)
VLDEDYYKRIEAIQFTMSHDDGKITNDIEKSDVVLLGISRTSKTPISIYLANRGYKTCNIPIINENSIPTKLLKNSKATCVVGLIAEPSRLSDVRKNRMNFLNEKKTSSYTDIEKIKLEVEMSKNIIKKNNWPIIDVTRKSVEESAASIIKIYDIIHSR